MVLLDLIKERHSIRKYQEKQINREDLEKILEAGNFAPNAGGGQRSMMVAVQPTGTFLKMIGPVVSISPMR